MVIYENSPVPCSVQYQVQYSMNIHSVLLYSTILYEQTLCTIYIYHTIPGPIVVYSHQSNDADFIL
jgi:hypothetical protein